LANAILDWRDADDLVHIDGAEKEEYQQAGLNYQPSNKPFESTEELQLILGMNKSVLSWLEPLVTVYSKQPQVTMTLASREVLQVIPGLDAGLLDSYIFMRLENAKNDLPAPTFPVSKRENNSADAKDVLTLVSEALIDDGSRASLSVVIKKSDNGGKTPFQILKWQPVTANIKSLFTDAMSEQVVKKYAEPELNN
jgi:general secretion pathway protein K